MNATEVRMGILPDAPPPSLVSTDHDLVATDSLNAAPSPCSVEDDGGAESMRARLRSSQVAQCEQWSPGSEPDPWLDMP
jgi:hypothetical protein